MVTIKTTIRETEKAVLVTFEEREGQYWVAKKIIEDNQVDSEKYSLEDVSKPKVMKIKLEKPIEFFSDKSVKVIVTLINKIGEEEKFADKFLFFAKTRVKAEGNTLELEEWMWNQALKNAKNEEEEYLKGKEEEVGELSYKGWEEVK